MDLLAQTEDAGDQPESESGAFRYPEAPARLPSKGDELGRYVVLRRLGAGAMGTVYLGYDPELDRKVALKILRGATGATNRRALLREAQAMAKLTHPNVVAVHDVGEHLGRVYVAMEFVEGETLGRWLGGEARAWREVVQIFVCAGRGLEAAHARELIHRDFKPDNVMVSREHKVLVMDFGLARPSSGPGEGEAQEDEELGSISGSLLTEATVGHLAGTPAYMAPEQARAEEVGPASDQFSFCVSMWEALCGERPIAGDSVLELLTNIADVRIRPRPSGVRMPRWLERVLLRGLAPAPADRWPSMGALLAALERGCRRWRWQAGLAGGLVLALSVGAGVSWEQREARELRKQVLACEQEGAAVDAIWNDLARERLRTGLLATGAGFAQDSVDTLVPWFDDYRDAWREGRTSACLHGAVERDWDAELLDRSTWCFEDRRLQLEMTVDQLASLDKKAARRAVRLASYLDPVASCLEPTTLRRLQAPPPSKRAEIRAIRKRFTEVDRLRHGGQFSEALELGREALAQAEALGWPPLLAHARFIEGRCLLITGRFAESEQSLARAYFEALDAGAIEVGFRAARSLMATLSRQQRYREAEVWSRHAEVLAAELQDPSGLDAAEGHYLLIDVYRGLGDYAAAREHGEAAVAMRSEALGVDHPITASAMRMLGQVHLAQGNAEQALTDFEQASVVWEEAVGHEHPHIGNLATLRGQALLALGRPDDALVLLEEGLALRERVLRAGHPNIARSLSALGEGYLALGRLDEAEKSQMRALEIRREKFGPRDPLTALSELDVAAVELARGRGEQALERSELALEIFEQTLASGHPEIERARASVVAAQRQAQAQTQVDEQESPTP